MIQKRILVVDDDLDLQSLLTEYLEHSGYHCDCVETAEIALERLQELKPDLVLLDLGLKDANGTAFLKHAGDWVKEGDLVPPVVVLSGHKSKEVVDYCMDQGAQAFIPKPFEIKHLIATVQNQLI